MKKKYVRPESCLFAINLSENIALGSDAFIELGGIRYMQNGTKGYFANNYLYEFDLTIYNTRGRITQRYLAMYYDELNEPIDLALCSDGVL